MATFVRSALNPSGTWQQDGLDQIELANRQFGANQMAQDRASQLALAQLQSQDARFGAERNDRMNMFNTGRQDQMNQFAAQADLTKAGWSHDDARHSGDLEAQLAIARLNKEPGDLERQKYQDESAMRNRIFSYLGIGGDPAGGAAPAVGQQLDPGKLQNVAALQALLHGGSVPDFAAQNSQRELLQLGVEEKKRGVANNRIQEALDRGDLAAAKAIAAESGVSLPRVDPNRLSGNVAFTQALGSADAEANRIGGKSYLGENFTPDSPLPADANLPAMIEAATQELVNRGADPGEARAFVISKLKEKFGTDRGGLNIPYVLQKGQSAVAQYLNGLR